MSRCICINLLGQKMFLSIEKGGFVPGKPDAGAYLFFKMFKRPGDRLVSPQEFLKADGESDEHPHEDQPVENVDFFVGFKKKKLKSLN